MKQVSSVYAGLAGKAKGIPPLTKVLEGFPTVMAVFNIRQMRHLLDHLHFFHSAIDLVFWDERGNGTLDDLTACAMDAVIKLVLGHLEAETGAT